MKKTLVALAVASLATSASAVTVLDAEGTKVDFEGSLRLVLEKASLKSVDANGKRAVDANGNLTPKVNPHTQLRNAGSRFGIKVKHELGEDFYALARTEFRFNGNSGNDGFGDLYAHRAYAGFGSKALGELTFGRQVTIADDLSQADDYEYGIIPKGNYAPTWGAQTIRYDYRGIEGLQLTANYSFGDKRDASNEVLVDEIKNSYGVGALYNVDGWDLRGAYSRTNYATGQNNQHHKDGYLASVGYAFGDFKLTGDFGYKFEKDGSERTKAFYVSPGFQYKVTPASRIYGNYLYERSETTLAKADASKAKTHGFLLGTDYKFHKQVVAFVEGKYVRTKEYAAGTRGYNYEGKTKDKAIGVGMRVYW